MRIEIDRRHLLTSVTLAGAGGLIGGVLGSAPAQAGAPKTADWKALARDLDGRLIRPGDSRYDRARRLYNPRFDAARPGGVAYCANPSDVAECVRFARRFGVPLTSRSGGHSYAGWSTGSGLVVDVSPMRHVEVSGHHATIGAGARLVDVYDRLAAKGVSIPAGSCPTVGIAGLTLGGGIGVVARKYGLTCDVLESLRVVTADGATRTCDTHREPDLYWASRGGGGGNFGIAVSFTYHTHPAHDVTYFFLRWPWAKAAKAVREWQRWAPDAPDELWSNLHLTREPTLRVQIGGLYLGGRADCERLLDRLTHRIGAEPISSLVRSSTYRHAMMVMAGCSNLSVSQCHREGGLPGETRDGTLTRDRFEAKSHMAYRPLSAAGSRALVHHVGKGGSHAVLLDALGGAVGRVAPGATAFPHRAALFSVQYVAHGFGAAHWLRAAHADMERHFGHHAYVNYIDAGLTGWRRAYYGANATRLARVKATYDPDRLFRFPQAI
jgi:FAD/FMN-containing dehydrogenase